MQRTVQTARNLDYPKLTWKSLDELDAGVCDGMTYDEIAEAYPEDYAARDDDKYNYVRALAPALLLCLILTNLYAAEVPRRRVL